MGKHRRKSEPVTRREVLRIVQRARDEILAALVRADPVGQRLMISTADEVHRWPGQGFWRLSKDGRMLEPIGENALGEVTWPNNGISRGPST